MSIYGQELILDLHGCDVGRFTEEGIERFAVELCELLGMTRCDFHAWGYDDPAERAAAPPHLAGISAIQFITTSNITIHTLDKLQRVYLNVFSCADFDAATVVDFCERYWEGRAANQTLVERA